jgi:predicted RNA binding protein YcfA (HicA-like mRNA interferase family)
MPNLPIIRARTLIKIAQKVGFLYEVTHGSHFIFRRPKDGKLLSIPVHKGRDLGKGITKAIIKDMDLTIEEFLSLL